MTMWWCPRTSAYIKLSQGNGRAIRGVWSFNPHKRSTLAHGSDAVLSYVGPTFQPLIGLSIKSCRLETWPEALIMTLDPFSFWQHLLGIFFFFNLSFDMQLEGQNLYIIECGLWCYCRLGKWFTSPSSKSYSVHLRLALVFYSGSDNISFLLTLVLLTSSLIFSLRLNVYGLR